MTTKTPSRNWRIAKGLFGLWVFVGTMSVSIIAARVFRRSPW